MKKKIQKRKPSKQRALTDFEATTFKTLEDIHGRLDSIVAAISARPATRELEVLQNLQTKMESVLRTGAIVDLLRNKVDQIDSTVNHVLRISLDMQRAKNLKKRTSKK